MKHIRLVFEDDEFELLEQQKRKFKSESWREFFLILIKPKEQRRNQR